MREAVFNALIHCNWADNVPIQIRIEEDVMFVSNCSMLPFGWTAETLLGSHTSKPYNPDIAKVFYRAGYIESWGRGIQKICDACKNLGAEEPEYIVHGEDIMVKLKALDSKKPIKADRKPIKADRKEIIVRYVSENGFIRNKEARELLGLADSTVKRVLGEMVEEGILMIEGERKTRRYLLRQ